MMLLSLAVLFWYFLTFCPHVVSPLKSHSPVPLLVSCPIPDSIASWSEMMEFFFLVERISSSTLETLYLAERISFISAGVAKTEQASSRTSLGVSCTRLSRFKYSIKCFM